MSVKYYRKKEVWYMYPWNPDVNMDDVNMSTSDLWAGSPKPGDMIAHNPNDSTDKWLIAAQFFSDHYEEVNE